LRFKLMLQQGITLDSIDPSYVSSLSLYFLCMFGLRGVLYIALGEGNKGDDMAIMQQQQQQMTGGPQADMAKLFCGRARQSLVGAASLDRARCRKAIV
jgi:hypothetical protein